MTGEQAEGFADNWSYLKTELNWLDRVLMVAVARQRKEAKELDRVSQSRADRATSHWWKGLVSLEGTVARDEYRKPTQPGGTAKPGYQQQLEAQIRASEQRGILLALPHLRDRLELTLFEKNLVLMSLAPEINRRYARIYRYLQGDDSATKTDLPTVDLVLRLLCRNDQEWRTARNRLMIGSPLVRQHLLKLLVRQDDTLLNYSLKLSDRLVDYLLADQPTPEALEVLLQAPVPSSQPASLLSYTTSITDWSALVLPPPLLASLQQLSQTPRGQMQLGEKWGMEKYAEDYPGGQVVVLAGSTGTGKTLAARAIASTAGVPLAMVDLALIAPEDYFSVLEEITARSPGMLLVKSAQYWLNRSSLLSEIYLNQFLRERRAIAGITMLSVCRQPSVRLYWQRQMDQVLIFPEPSLSDRLRLWQQAVPPQVPFDPTINWQHLAQLRLTGGQIGAIVRRAVISLAASGDPQLTMLHLQQALEQHKTSMGTFR